MVVSYFEYFVLFLAALIFVGLITPAIQKVAISLDITDKPIEKHKTHSKPVPYLGGVAIVLGVFLISTSFSLLSNPNRSDLYVLMSVLVPSIILSMIGLIDDIIKLSPWPRFVAQNVVGLIVFLYLSNSGTLGSPSGVFWIDALFSVLWITGITNAMNFFDNVDGGASGSAAISSIGLFGLAIYSNQFMIAALSIVLAGATIGFLIWNKPPARIYMGDAGALFLGILLASLTLRYEPTPINRFAGYLIPVLLLAVPILDTSVAVLSRIAEGRSPFQGGKDHLSHRLIAAGLSKRASIYSLWLLSIFFIGAAFVITLSPYKFEGALSIFVVLLWFGFLIGFLKFKKI